jgi:hypothetical protein
MNYAIVIGNIFTNYTGSTLCTGLSVYSTCEIKEEARAIVTELYETVTDLVLVIDLRTGIQCEDI